MTATASVFGRDPMPDILLVEDNALHVRLVKSMLTDVWPEPNNLRIARRLSSGIKALEDSRPDCVLLDLLLPDADGLEAVNAFLAADHTLPIVVLSSHDDDELALQAVREGAQDYLVKGTVGPVGLARAVRFSIQRHRMDRAGAAATPVPPVSDLVSAGVVIVDGDGVVTHIQPDIAEMLGRDIDGLVGRNIADITHPNDVANWVRGLETRGDAGSEFTLRVRHASGTDLRVRVELTPLEGDGRAYMARWYPQPEEGTHSSGGSYAVVREWVGG